MIDHNGEEWLVTSEAARRVRVNPATIWKWVERGKVRAHRIGKFSWVNMPDLAAAEDQWTRRAQNLTGARTTCQD